MPEPLSGGCQCGALRYLLTAAPIATYVCHCRECRRQSASAFGISVIAPRAGFAVTAGEARRWSRPTDSGNTLHCRFCPICGGRVWHESDIGETVSIKGGTFDIDLDLTDAVHIWTARRLPGVDIARRARQFPGEPP
jgi:hypothetical protein